jgi:hypothetical protein
MGIGSWRWFALQVSVRILGGLMALGYEIGTIMKRTSTVYSDDCLTVKLDDIEGMGRQFIQACSRACCLPCLEDFAVGHRAGCASGQA